MPPRKRVAKSAPQMSQTPARRVTRSALREGSAEPLIAATSPPKRQRKSTRSRSNSIASQQAPPSSTGNSGDSDADVYTAETLPSLPEQEEEIAAQLQIELADTASLVSYPEKEPSVVADELVIDTLTTTTAAANAQSVAEAEQTGMFGLSSQQSALTPVQPASSKSARRSSQRSSQQTPQRTSQRTPQQPELSESVLGLDYSPAVDVTPGLTLMERVLSSSASLVYQLTPNDRTALVLSLRREVLRLRRMVEEDKVKSPESSPVMTSMTKGGRNNLRYRFSIAQPAAEAAAARAAAAAQHNEVTASSPEATRLSSSSSSSSVLRKSSSTQPVQAKSSPRMHQTPEKQATTPMSMSTSASPTSWGLSSLFGTVKRVFSGPGRGTPSPQKTTATESLQQYTSPTPRAPKTPKTPTPAESLDETPARTERRRGTLPGSARASRKTPGRTPARTPGPRPKPQEPNADRRFEQLQQAAERQRVQEREQKQQDAERKRIQQQTVRIEEEKRKAEEEQKKLDDEDAARQEIGNKRKRVRVDDLKHIPACRPGQSGYGMLDEFFSYDSDSDEDDYVEMDIDDIELLTPRPNKKMRLDENVFVPTSPTKQSSAVSPATPLPNYARQQEEAVERQRLLATQHKPRRPSGLRQVSTGSPNNGTTLTSSPDMQLADTPQIVSSSPFSPTMTPSAPPVTTPYAPSTTYLEAPYTVLSNITEVTEPETPVPSNARGRVSEFESVKSFTPMSTTSEHFQLPRPMTTPTPASQTTPASRVSRTSLGVPSPVPTPPSPTVSEDFELNASWPLAVDLWPGVERLPITAEEQAESDRQFNAGVLDRLWREQRGLASTTEIPGF
ncbi:hypothetical protein MBLNU459_g8513t1 [Dothideomycetes sp. NU459]